MSFLHLHAEQAARTGVAVTTAGITTSFVATALPVVQFIGAIIAVCVGLATFVYYALMIREKIRAKK